MTVAVIPAPLSSSGLNGSSWKLFQLVLVGVIYSLSPIKQQQRLLFCSMGSVSVPPPPRALGRAPHPTWFLSDFDRIVGRLFSRLQARLVPAAGFWFFLFLRFAGASQVLL